MPPTLCKRECCDLSRIAAEADFFLRIDFLEMKEDEWDTRLSGGDALVIDASPFH
jgi:hypothetical protein